MNDAGRRYAVERRQEAALRAYIETGTIKGAAHRMGITEKSVRKYIAGYCEAHDYKSPVQAAFHFGNSERSENHQP